MNYLNMNEEELIPVASELNLLLADYHIYYQKLRSFHWNILGKNFFDLHNKFEEMYGDARVKIDEIAERILTLRHHTVSDFSEYLKMSSIKESPAMITDTEMVEEILSDHGKIINQMRKAVIQADIAGDEGTKDLLGAYIGSLEKSSWMLDAWSKSTNEQLSTAVIGQSS